MERVNVTQKVVAKYEEGRLKLYMDGSKIGEVIETDQGLQHSMYTGFSFEQEQIFQQQNEDWDQVQSFIEDSWH
ncbi:DUF2553 family protein [Bacillus sp. JCM 19041]|uniref:DUF2553 family protein n=1 Tax=Bacillus sp. JCM 19041 TaxID=1460637 RepID=UPI0006D0389D